MKSILLDKLDSRHDICTVTNAVKYLTQPYLNNDQMFIKVREFRQSTPETPRYVRYGRIDSLEVDNSGDLPKILYDVEYEDGSMGHQVIDMHTGFDLVIDPRRVSLIKMKHGSIKASVAISFIPMELVPSNGHVAFDSKKIAYVLNMFGVRRSVKEWNYHTKNGDIKAINIDDVPALSLYHTDSKDPDMERILEKGITSFMKEFNKRDDCVMVLETNGGCPTQIHIEIHKFNNVSCYENFKYFPRLDMCVTISIDGEEKYLWVRIDVPHVHTIFGFDAINGRAVIEHVHHNTWNYTWKSDELIRVTISDLLDFIPQLADYRPLDQSIRTEMDDTTRHDSIYEATQITFTIGQK